MLKDGRYLTVLLALTAVYIAAGKVGLLLASVNESVSPVWPPTGIAIAALLLYGLRLWPAILVGAFVVNLTTSGDIPSSVGIAVGNTLEAVAAAWLTFRFANGTRAFLHGNTVFRYAFFAALVGTAISASIGTASLVAAGLADTSQLGPIWLTWWMGDAGGALVVAPPIVLWLSRVPPLRDGGDGPELAALIAATALTAVFLFTPLRPFRTSGSPVAFIALPVLVWAAFRFGPRIASTVLAALAMIAAWAVANGLGPLATASPNEALLFLQGATAVVSVMTLALAAGVLERQETDDRLRAAEAELLQAEARKVAERDEFLGIAAHELRTPLTSLQLAVQILQRDAASPEGAKRSLQTVGSQTARLGQLVGQLLDTVRIDTGRFALEPEEKDVAALTRGAVEEAQASTDRHEIVLAAPEELHARVDPLRLEQVLRNLLDNAVKFSPGGGRVEVELEERGADFRISIRDYGQGVPAEHRALIFERSYQGPVDPRSGGLGLGLHVSRHIVQLHGGNIEAEFPHDGGTRIVVDLPLGGEGKETT